MKYKVLDTFKMGKSTSVTIQGNGNGLMNGMEIKDESGRSHRIESVAMVECEKPENVAELTTLLISGSFEGREICC